VNSKALADVRRAIQLAKRASKWNLRGKPIQTSDNQLSDNWAMNTFPNLLRVFTARDCWMLRYEPHRRDPEKNAIFTALVCFARHGIPSTSLPLPPSPRCTPSESSGRPSRVQVKHDDADIIEKIGLLIYEDISLQYCGNGSRHGSGRLFNRMWLSEQEQVIMHQHAEMDRYLNR